MVADAPLDSALLTSRRDEMHSPQAALAGRVTAYERRLYRALLLARALVPTAILCVLAAAATHNDASVAATAVWAAIAAWTCTTSPLIWSRLDWVRRFPLPARLETAAFVLLVFFGAGARPWHLLHSFVPLVFVALFVGERAAAIVATAIAGALWAVYGVLALWPGAPVQTRLNAAVPTIVVLGTALLFTFVRRLLEDVETISRQQQKASDAIGRAGFALAVQRATGAVYDEIARPLLASATALAEAAARLGDVPAALRDSKQALADCVQAVAASVGDLRYPPANGTSEEGQRSLADVARTAVATTAALGGVVDLTFDGAGGGVVAQQDEPALRRLLTEALANARKHRVDGVIDFAVGARAPQIALANRAAGPIRERTGGFGVSSMRGDATEIEARLSTSFADGIATVEVTLSDAAREQSPAAAIISLRRTVADRRREYAVALFALRLGAAVLTVVTIQTGSRLHRSLLPALTATSLVLVVWNAALLLAQLRRSPKLQISRTLAIADVTALATLVLLESGMASPWFDLTLGALMLMAIATGPRAIVASATAFSVALLAGYYLSRLLALHDVGTQQQDMPFGWILNSFIYAVGAAIAVSVGWIFVRIEEGIGVYDRLAREREELDREAAAAEAHVHARRELHASLQQYVHAALVYLGSLEPVLGATAAFHAVDTELVAIRDQLREGLAQLAGGYGRTRG